ncbi:MAG: YegP family protein, partial [Candidatus Hodarchaeota archaeon]
ANHETIGMSEMYESKQGRDNGIDSVKENAPMAPIEDIT